MGEAHKRPDPFPSASGKSEAAACSSPSRLVPKRFDPSPHSQAKHRGHRSLYTGEDPLETNAGPHRFHSDPAQPDPDHSKPTASTPADSTPHSVQGTAQDSGALDPSCPEIETFRLSAVV